MSAEPAPAAFVDTNIRVYVLQELFVTLTRKVRKPMTPQQALRYLDQIAA
jgi:hypothetical protein